ncbi:Trihelix transcription factor [Nymphaea thermarum]|nr:Trihelix transcription factor [Nymphaea thermarum]
MVGSSSSPPPPPPPRPVRPSPTGREDCWSEGATLALIEAWGDRHINLSRGNLKQQNWLEVADRVNARFGGLRHRKTDSQCKNRIDTLKKKYKLERAKVVASGGVFVSRWPYFSQIDDLVGPGKGQPSAGAGVRTLQVPVLRSPRSIPSPRPANGDEQDLARNQVVNSAANSGASSRSRDSTKSSPIVGGGGDEDDGSEGGLGEKGEVGAGFRDLARAIMGLSEVYEKIESSKQQQMVDLEKQRMVFAKELEFQRMQMLMEAYVELEKMKRRF